MFTGEWAEWALHLDKKPSVCKFASKQGGRGQPGSKQHLYLGWLQLMRDLEGRQMTVNEQIVSPLRGCCLAPSPRYVCSAKKMTKTKTKTKIMTKTNTFRERLQWAILETCDLWDIWSEWWEHMTWPKIHTYLHTYPPTYLPTCLA